MDFRGHLSALRWCSEEATYTLFTPTCSVKIKRRELLQNSDSKPRDVFLFLFFLCFCLFVCFFFLRLVFREAEVFVFLRLLSWHFLLHYQISFKLKELQRLFFLCYQIYKKGNKKIIINKLGRRIDETS